PDRHVGEHPGLRHDPLAVDRVSDFAFEDVEAFLLPAVDVQWGTAAWTHERFKEGVPAVGVLAGRQETVHVTDDANGAALGCVSDDGLGHGRLLHEIMVGRPECGARSGAAWWKHHSTLPLASAAYTAATSFDCWTATISKSARSFQWATHCWKSCTS